MQYLGRVANKLLKTVGLRVAKIERPRDDYIDFDCDPVMPSYTARQSEYVVTVPLEHCRALHPVFFAFPPHATNPYTETLRRYERGTLQQYKDSPLEQHYSKWQPRNAAEAIGLNPQDCTPTIRNSAAVNFVFPWEAFPPSSVRRREKTEKENLEFGLRLSSTHGDKGFGPVSFEKGELEFNRFVRVFKSIQETGYTRSNTKKDGDLRGRVLRARCQSVVIVTTGAHRLAALSTLGYTCAPVRICWPTIYRDDVELWPNVVSNLFEKEEALAVFDRIFNGQWPETLGYGPRDAMCSLTLDA